MDFHRSPRRLRNGLLATLALASLAACTSYSDRNSPAAQMEFGSDMARRGYWREARFRWEQAAAKRADDPHLWSNLAVASEALGEYTQALEQYKKALALAPGDPRVKENYARFAEFYSNFSRGRLDEDALKKKSDEAFKPPPRFRR